MKQILSEIRQVIKQGFGEIKQETSEVVVQQDLMREFREELVAARRRCEGSTEIVRSRVEEVVPVQSPVSDQQLCGVTGHCELRVSVADMEEPCLLGLDSLFGNAVCDDLGRMQRHSRHGCW